MSLTSHVSSPIAVVGVGLRFPGGVRSLPAYGRLLAAGEPALGPVPADRWGRERCGSGPGTTANHVGAFLPDVDRFDAAYFGVPPREAHALDPQHRLFLEVAWEAMTDSGRSRDDWRGSNTGVVVGMLANDYSQLQARALGTDAVGPGHTSGLEFSFAAGRLAYTFDLRGPAQAVNSACSSSLLAVHQACQYLRSGECDRAVAGGVSLILTPDNSVFLSSVGALSPTGHCRPFDETADGIVRGEGCGAVVLRRLDDALADGDRIHAVLRGSVVNNDGGSLGLTLPSAQAQADLLRSTLSRTGLTAGDVDYVEAHGTGTPLGDLIELDTLGAVYGAGHDPDRPVYVGSHKALLGHMDAAAGMGGLLKAIWVAGTGTIPAQPSVRTPNPGVDWRDGALAVPLEPVRTDPGRPVRTGVSAFGMSGTNVHVVVESPPDPDPADTPVRQPYVLLASALDARGLEEQLALLRTEVAGAEDDLGHLVTSAAARRTHETHRFAAVSGDREGLLAALADPAEPPDGAYIGEIADPRDAPGPVFVFSGQGGQWSGMALDLYAEDQQARAALDECAELVRAQAGWSLLDELRRARDGDRPDPIATVQPAIFAVQVALARCLAHRGVRPSAVVGHSLGEVAAAHAAGGLELADAVQVVLRRSEVLAGFAGHGRMLAVHAGPEEVTAALGALPVEVVAVNGPSSVIVAGASEAMAEAAASLEGSGLRHRRLRVDAPAHSALVADGGPELAKALPGLSPLPPAARLLSTVAPGAPLPPLDAAYWARNFTSPVRLWPTIDLLLADEDHPLVEIGPHPVLLPALVDAQRARRRRAPALGVSDRALPGPTALARAMARLHTAGVPVDWAAAVGSPRRYRSLPVPSWRDRRYWLPGVPRGEQAGPAPAPAPVRVDPPDAENAVTREPAAPRPGRNRLSALVEHIDGLARELLGLADDDPPLGRRRGLFEQGFDSLRAVSLRNRLQERFGAELPSTLVVERPSVRALAEYLAERIPDAGLDTGLNTGLDTGLDTGSAAGPDSGRDAEPEEEPDPEAVAITGIACRLPAADSPAAFWELLLEGACTAAETPPGRRDDPMWREAGAGIPDRASCLEDISGFDAPFFRVSPREARLLDPQQRLFLEVAWEALEDAGCPAPSLAGRPVGVYAGVGSSEYQFLVARGMAEDDAPATLHHGTGTSSATLAGRVSYLLGLEGPSLAVDTACSSSLTAVHLACQALRAGDCETALVGGVSAMVAPTPLMASMAGSGALAPDGRCKTFDEDADGFGVGEGAVVLILKPLADALRDGDRVHAVLRSSAVNQDGATGGMTVPNGAAQASLVRAALDRAGWTPPDVDYIEAHGTGTPLGDPVEVHALAEVFGQGRPADAPLLIGSAKANVGHLAAAAGAVGLLKVVLALRAGQLPPHPLSRPSTRIAWDRLPVAPVPRITDWPRRARPARAGVSAFGFSGTNVHVMVEQAPARTERPSGPPPYVLPVSASSPTALRVVAARLAGVLRSGGAAAGDVAFTAMHRRALLEHRAVVVGTDAAELAQALEHVAQGTDHPRVRHGRVAPGERQSVAFRYGDGTSPRWSSPAYRQALEELSTQVSRILGRACDLTSEQDGVPSEVYAFCRQVAATRAWAALGVRPDSVVCTGGGIDAAWSHGRIDTVTALRRLLDGTDGTDGSGGPAAAPPAAFDDDADRVVDVLPEQDPALLAAELVASGYRPVAPESGGPLVDLPPYPWERKPYWYTDGTTRSAEEPVVAPGPVVSWPIGADSADGVREQARRLARSVRADAETDLARTGRALAGRPAGLHRLVVTGTGPDELLAGLDAAASGAAAPSVRSGVALSELRPVLVFPGQGPQWAGMGARLLDSSPLFARTVGECSTVVEELAGWSVLRVLREGMALDRMDVIQPTMFAVMTGLARLWQELGVVPAAVVGHSQGEVAAACVAGALELPEATRVVVERSAALRELAGEGAMVSLAAGRHEAAALLPDGWGVAAVNGPHSTVVSGPALRLEELVKRCEGQGVRTRVIPSDCAAHSPDVERLRVRLLERLGKVTCRPGRIPMYSTVTGAPVDGAAMDAQYWYDNLRRPVRFQDATEALARAGYNAFVECSAHPVLVPALEETLDALGGERAAVMPTLRRDEDTPARVHTAAAQAWTHGLDVRWPALLAGGPPGSGTGRRHSWPEGEEQAEPDPAGTGHGLLGTVTEVAGREVVLSGRLSPRRHPWLEDHVAKGSTIVPGTAFLDAVVRAGDEVGADLVRELLVEAPLPVQEAGVDFQVVVDPPEDGERRVAVYARQCGVDGAGWNRHARAVVAEERATRHEAAAGPAFASLRQTSWPPPGAEPVPVDDLYPRLAERGYGYGPAFRGLRSAWRRGDEVFAEVELPEPTAREADRFGLHPALLDAAGHALSGSPLLPDDGMWLPFSWDDVRLFASGARGLRVHLSRTGQDGVRIAATDPAGGPVVLIEGLRFRKADVASLTTAGTAEPLVLDWEPVTVPTHGAAPGEWAVLGSDTLDASLPVYADVAALVDASRQSAALPRHVLLPVAGARPDTDDVAAQAHRVGEEVLASLQRWLAEPSLETTRLILVTRGAVAVDGGAVTDPAAAVAWGMVRTAQSEQPGRFVLLDLDPRTETAWPGLRNVLSGCAEPQFAVRGHEVRAPRLVRAGDRLAGLGGLGTGVDWRVDLAGGGERSLDAVHRVPVTPRPLREGEVRLAVRAAGLDLHDVAVTFGEVADRASLGAEGAGVVLETGPGVRKLRAGDRVMGMFPGAFAARAVADAGRLVPVPEGWSFEEAASVPGPFLVAYHALVDLAGWDPRPGACTDRSVLVHEAAGGVGMAAVQLATAWGATVYATSSPETWDVVAAMGVPAERTASSRTVEFADRFLDRTGGLGVDVVLGPVEGPTADASLRLLPRGGDYLTWDDVDSSDTPDLVVADRSPGVRYRALRLREIEPEHGGRTMSELSEMFRQGRIRPLPHRSWELDRIRQALRHMSRDPHTGRNVLRIPVPFDPHGTVLITGGTGTLGGRVAAHLARRHGARHLLLLSRRGPDAPGAARLREELEEAGAEVTMTACDVTDGDALAAALASVPADRPLTAVVQATVALRDAVLTAMTSDDLHEVLRAKVDTAVHLHRLTRDRDLAAALLFSSSSGILGGGGQANYAAANAFLDALASCTRAQGYPATSLAWGLWEETSDTTSRLSEADRARMARSAITAMTTEHGLAVLDSATHDSHPWVLAANLDTGQVTGDPLWSRLVAAPARPTAATSANLVARLAGEDPEQRRRTLLTAVRTHTAAVLAHPTPDTIEPDREFLAQGLDSLLAIELRNRLNTATGLRLRATTVFAHPTPHALAAHLAQQLGEDAPAEADQPTPRSLPER